MATINSKEIVDEIIAGNGYYEDDPRVVKIVKYTNNFGGKLCYGLIYQSEDLDRYHASEYILSPETLWEAS